MRPPPPPSSPRPLPSWLLIDRQDRVPRQVLSLAWPASGSGSPPRLPETVSETVSPRQSETGAFEAGVEALDEAAPITCLQGSDPCKQVMGDLLLGKRKGPEEAQHPILPVDHRQDLERRASAERPLERRASAGRARRKSAADTGGADS